MTNFEGPMTKN